MDPSSERRAASPSKAVVTRALGGVAVGLGLTALILVLAGAPPFDFALAQTGAPAAKQITGAGGNIYWLPPNASAHGGEIDFLFNLITAIVGIIFVGVEVCLVVFAFRYRATPGRRAQYTHGNQPLEIAWTVTPALILLVLVILSKSTWSKLRYGDPPADATQVGVTAQQFQWNFKMLGTASRLGLKEDLVPPAGLVHVPLGKPVAVELRSKDVLHSFYLVNMRVKLDAVPGMTGHVWFTPTQAGSFEVACAELCGAEHWSMRGVLHVDTPEAYQKWLDEEAVIQKESEAANAPK